MKVKDSTVNIEALHPKMKDRLTDIETIYTSFHTELVITSGKDGVHSQHSLHYEGKAVDLRTWNILDSVIQALKTKLGPEYDVILEKDHIHVEWDPEG